MKTITMLFVLCGALVFSAPAQQQEAITSGLPKLKPAVEITDLRILGTPTKGATVTLQVRFRSHVKGSGILMLRYPGHLAPPGRRPEEKFRTQPLFLEGGSWTATALGGTGNTYRFRWYKRDFGSNNWGWPVRDVTLTTHTDTYSTTMLTTSFELKVEVTRGLETATATQLVFYGGGLCQPGRPCEPLVAVEEPLPETYALEAPYPNPAHGRTTIRFALPETAPVRLVVYDALGREVVRLADGWYEPGYHTVQLEATALPPGLYVCRLVAGPFTRSYPLVLTR